MIAKAAMPAYACVVAMVGGKVPVVASVCVAMCMMGVMVCLMGGACWMAVEAETRKVAV